MTEIQRGLVSIALATYNGERYLRAQLDSIFAQTVTQLEVIAVDDGSSDRTVEILQEYAEHSPLTFHCNPNNLGFRANFERAIGLCTGEFIALADQDDIWYPHKLECLLSKIENMDLVYSDADLVDEAGNPTGGTLRSLYDLDFVRGACVRSLLFYECASGNTMLFRQSLVSAILPIPPDLSYHDIWITFVCAASGRIEYIDQSLLAYRRHSDNITRKTYQQSFQARFECMRWIKRRKTIVRKLKEMAKYSALNSSDQEFLDEAICLLSKLRKHFFNLSLFRFLYAQRQEIFAIKHQKKYVRRCLDHAMGFNMLRCKLTLDGLWQGIKPRSRSKNKS